MKIEFRIWDEELQKMIPPNENYDFVLTMDGKIQNYHREEYQNLIPLFYTNNNDKNGIKIYMGDIVKWVKERVIYNEAKDELESVYDELISFIEFRGQSFWVNHESFGWEGESLWDWSEMEVIGNIYENKDIFKKIDKVEYFKIDDLENENEI